MQGNASSADTAAITELFRQYSTTLNAGDIDAWIALWTDDGVQMPPDGPPVEGKAQIRDRNGQSLVKFSIAMDPITIQEVTVAGEWAYARGIYTATFTPKAGGPPAPVDGKYLTIFRRSLDSTWKIHRDCFNSNVPPATT